MSKTTIPTTIPGALPSAKSIPESAAGVGASFVPFGPKMGSKLFTGQNSTDVTQLGLGSSFDVSETSNEGSFRLSDVHDTDTLKAISFTPEGDRLFAAHSYQGKLAQYELSTPFDITTTSFFSAKNFTEISYFLFSNRGTKMVVYYNIDGTDSSAAFQEFDVPNGRIANASPVAQAELGGDPQGMALDRESQERFFFCTYDGAVIKVETGDPLSLSGATSTQIFYASPHLRDMSFNADGSSLFLLTDSGDIIAYDLEKKYDPSVKEKKGQSSFSDRTEAIAFN